MTNAAMLRFWAWFAAQAYEIDRALRAVEAELGELEAMNAITDVRCVAAAPDGFRPTAFRAGWETRKRASLS